MSDYASAIIGSQKTHKRKPADFYPTPPDVTVAIMRQLGLNRDTRIWEPACGDGAMAQVLLSCCDNVFSSDLRDDSGYGIGGMDFLTASGPGSVDWIITNPPFSHAEQFIRKALSVTPNVAMLLKSTYWHAAKRHNLFLEHRPSRVLPLTWRPSFLEKERGSSPLMDVLWVLWEGGATHHTEYVPLKRPSDYRALRAQPIDMPDPVAEAELIDLFE